MKEMPIPMIILNIIINTVVAALIISTFSGCEAEDFEWNEYEASDSDIDGDTDIDTGDESDINQSICNKLANIEGDWYNMENDELMTVTLTPAPGNTCEADFQGYGTFTFLQGIYEDTHLPMVRKSSCGNQIVTMLSDGTLVQSGYA